MEYKEALERIKTYCNSENGYPYNQYMQSSTPRNEDLEIIERALEDYSGIKDKIKNGTLIELPCITYNVKEGRYQIISSKNGRIFASKFYLTREQAEAKLKELKGKE